jgi:DNA-binding PadR family transcriptional regulator
MIAPGIKRGSTELAILSVVADGPLHGYDIARRIEHDTRGSLRFTLASLYPMLYRLERRGWLKSAWEETRAGRRRRRYRITSTGRARLAELSREWRAYFRALNRLLEASHA